MKSLIDNWTKGVDTYTHNGSTWLIFTDSKRWVIELTEDKTLWYNYNFFKQIFSLTSLDVVENQQYITKWVEDNVMNKVKDTRLEINITEGEVDDIIQDGVKKTDYKSLLKRGSIEDTIENGVKETKISPTHTEYGDWLDGDERLDEIIQNGVKETNHVDVMGFFDNKMEDTLQNGVKETSHKCLLKRGEIEDIIDGGVKETIELMNELPNRVKKIIKKGVRHTFNTEYMPTSMVEDIIQSGVKLTQFNDNENKSWVEGVIKNGVKETKTPGKDGDIMSTVEWMNENNSSSYTKMINDVLDNGVKETKHANRYESIGPVFKESKIENVIENGDKVSGTFVGGKRQKEDVESVIGYGTKN